MVMAAEARDQEDGVGRPSLPHSIEAEQALLGAILINNDALGEIIGVVAEDDFFEPVHGRVFAAAAHLWKEGRSATPVTVKQYFENDGALADVGGASYIARLAGAAVTTINAPDYAKTIRDLSLRRQLIAYGEQMVEDCQTPEVTRDGNDILAELQERLDSLNATGQRGGSALVTTAADATMAAIERAYQTKGTLSGVTTGLGDLDRRLGGLQAGDLVILAGRPSMGKSALAIHIADSAALAGHTVGLVSLEMMPQQIIMRLLARRTGIPFEDQRRGTIDANQFLQLDAARHKIDDLPLLIETEAGLGVAQIAARARALKRRRGLDLLIIDYLGLIRPAREFAKAPKVYQIEETTQACKDLAKALNIPVLLLSQLNRQVEQRDNKRPMLSDLRDSGALEQDADQVIFAYREEYYLERNQPDPGDGEAQSKWEVAMAKAANKTELIIAKNRHGATGSIAVFGDMATGKFGSLEGRDGSA